MAFELEHIEHIVILMMENRSFDNMLGYLSLEGGRTDVDGLKADMSNQFNGNTYPVHRATARTLPGDVCHDGSCVDEQISKHCGGFVSNYARVAAAGSPLEVVMGYHNAIDVPVYDHLAREFLICDRWFSSIAGPTIPNRMYAVAGQAQGMRSNPRTFPPPAFNIPTIFDYLDAATPPIAWKAFAGKRLFSMLRLFQNFKFTGRIGSLNEFFPIAAAGRLPALTWLEPDYGILSQATQNDDHPPVDIWRGQKLVAEVYNTLLDAAHGAWERTAFVVTYDEHGGLYDHVSPLDPPIPRPKDDPLDGKLSYGVRVPAFVLSPWVSRGGVGHEILDHTSILKTILERFLRTSRGGVPQMHARVNAARSLWHFFTEVSPREDCTQAAPPFVATSVSIVEGTETLGRRPARAEVIGSSSTPASAMNDYQLILKSVGEEARRHGLDA